MMRGVEMARRQWACGAGWMVAAAAVLIGLGSAPLVAQTETQTAQAGQATQAAQGIAGTWQGTMRWAARCGSL